ncbi:MAG: zf-HC2 domain-containing protein [Gammaproteobacteria bacterium]|nr:zf-HC2 domain-containing protein [Gammaproteobacteria bacterium]
MKNCKIVLTELDDFLDGGLNPVQHDQLQSHIAGCKSCYQAWQQELQFRQALQDQVVPAPAFGLEERAFAKIPRQQPAKARRNTFAAGFAGAIAAGLMIMTAASLFFSPATEQAIPDITLSLHQSKKVNMVFDVPEMVADATFSMKVPAHVEIAGKTDLHQIEWKTALKKGKNQLSLPIVAKIAESGELVAEIRYGNQIKRFRMKLNILPAEQGSLEIIKPGVV